MIRDYPPPIARRVYIASGPSSLEVPKINDKYLGDHTWVLFNSVRWRCPQPWRSRYSRWSFKQCSQREGTKLASFSTRKGVTALPFHAVAGMLSHDRKATAVAQTYRNQSKMT